MGIRSERSSKVEIKKGGIAGTSRETHRRAPTKLWALVCVMALGFFVQGQAAYAATITVNTTADQFNANGDCSLHEALEAANTDHAVDGCPAGRGADTIVVPAGAYALTSGNELDIASNVSISGAGASAAFSPSSAGHPRSAA
jgi:CSLREA domain-containing protein